MILSHRICDEIIVMISHNIPFVDIGRIWRMREMFCKDKEVFLAFGNFDKYIAQCNVDKDLPIIGILPFKCCE